MKGKIYELCHFDIKPNTLTNDSTIRLNWILFKNHISKCKKCQHKAIVIMSHIVKEDLD